MTSSHIARQMWTRFEPLHAVTYFTPEARAAYEAAGLRGYWRGYFAGRFAPMGPVDSVPVISSAFGFAPGMVARAVPDVWSRATPEATLAARREGAEAALSRILADPDASVLGEVAALAEEAVARLERGGHPIGAANAALARPEGAVPLARIWQAATTMREHRGDSHVAALVAYGFSGVESVIWRCDPAHRADMQSYRGWTDDEWDAASARLVERGWLTKDGIHTPQGDTVYAAVEAATDRADARVWHELGTARTERLRELLTPLATATYSGIPLVNPVGVPTPAEADAAAAAA
jgi:hypothetical protein